MTAPPRLPHETDPELEPLPANASLDAMRSQVFELARRLANALTHLVHTMPQMDTRIEVLEKRVDVQEMQIATLITSSGQEPESKP